MLVCIRLHAARAGVMQPLHRVQGGVLLLCAGPSGRKRHLQVNQHQDTWTLSKLRPQQGRQHVKGTKDETLVV